jgi:hypothetical protein
VGEDQILDRAKSLIDVSGELAFLPPIEVSYGHYFLRLTSPDITKAEEHFLRAIKIARNHETHLFELRAATSLARLWQSQGKAADARDLLERFTI